MAVINEKNLGSLLGALLGEGMDDSCVTIHGDGDQGQDGGVHADVLRCTQ